MKLDSGFMVFEVEYPGKDPVSFPFFEYQHELSTRQAPENAREQNAMAIECAKAVADFSGWEDRQVFAVIMSVEERAETLGNEREPSPTS